MRVTIDLDKKLLEDVQSRLGNLSKKAPNAISNSLNRSMNNIATNISKEVRKEYNMKAKDIKATLVKTRSTRSTLGAVVKSKGELIPLDRFRVSPKTVQPKRKAPIKVGVKKPGLKPLLGAFVADISGKKVFKRTGKKRLPVRRLFGPSIPQMIGNEEIARKIDEEGQKMFQKRMDHEINRILDRG